TSLVETTMPSRSGHPGACPRTADPGYPTLSRTTHDLGVTGRIGGRHVDLASGQFLLQPSQCLVAGELSAVLGRVDGRVPGVQRRPFPPPRRDAPPGVRRDRAAVPADCETGPP